MGKKARDSFVETRMQQHLLLPKICLSMHLCEPVFIFYSNFLLSEELASFFFLAFLEKGKKKKSAWSRHTWLSSLWKALCLFLPLQQLHFIFSEQTTNSQSWSCTENEREEARNTFQISAHGLLRFFYIYIKLPWFSQLVFLATEISLLCIDKLLEKLSSKI